MWPRFYFRAAPPCHHYMSWTQCFLHPPRPGHITLPGAGLLGSREVLHAADAWLFPGASMQPSPLFAFWKPHGVISTMGSEPKNLKVFLENSGQPVVQHIGRLDKGTTGLLLLSDNGDLHRILLAPGGILKTYIATETCSNMCVLEIALGLDKFEFQLA